MFARSVIAHHDIFLAIIRSANVDVRVRKSGFMETLRHRLGRGAHVTYRIGGVDFNQLLEDVVGELIRGVIKLGIRDRHK